MLSLLHMPRPSQVCFATSESGRTIRQQIVSASPAAIRRSRMSLLPERGRGQCPSPQPLETPIYLGDRQPQITSQVPGARIAARQDRVNDLHQLGRGPNGPPQRSDAQRRAFVAFVAFAAVRILDSQLVACWNQRNWPRARSEIGIRVR